MNRKPPIMKPIIRIITILLLVISFVFTPEFASADSPPPPPNDPNVTTDPPVGGKATIDGGLAILLILGAGYGAKKVYDLYTKKKARQNTIS